jgi:RNA polymerase sigma factor (sigma-70 family)
MSNIKITDDIQRNLEQKLINSSLNNDEEAFKELIELCVPNCRFTIKKDFHLSNFDLDDLTQIVTVKAWKNLSKFRKESSFYTWINSIFRNEAATFLIKKKNLQNFEVLSSLKLEEVEELNYSLANEDLNLQLNQTGEAILQYKEDIEEYRNIVENALHKLSLKYSDILKMIILEDKTYSEVAEILQIPVGSVMSRFYYAKKYAKKIIKEYARVNSIELTHLG